MRRMTALLGIIALATVSMVMAQTPPAPQEQPAAEKTFMGEIASVNANAKTITVRESSAAREPGRTEPTPAQPGQRPEAAGKSMTFTLDAQTKITSKAAAARPSPAPQERPGMGQEKLELEDLKEGDRVSVKYTESAGKNVAKSVEVVSRGATSN